MGQDESSALVLIFTLDSAYLLWMLELLVALGSIVRGTQHFAVGQGGCATLRPRSYVVGIRLSLLIDICLFRVLTDNAEQTIRHTLGLGLLGLPLISEVFRLAVKRLIDSNCAFDWPPPLSTYS